MGKISYLYILYASTTNVLTDKKRRGSKLIVYNIVHKEAALQNLKACNAACIVCCFLAKQVQKCFYLCAL